MISVFGPEVTGYRYLWVSTWTGPKIISIIIVGFVFVYLFVVTGIDFHLHIREQICLIILNKSRSKLLKYEKKMDQILSINTTVCVKTIEIRYCY